LLDTFELHEGGMVSNQSVTVCRFTPMGTRPILTFSFPHTVLGGEADIIAFFVAEKEKQEPSPGDGQST